LAVHAFPIAQQPPPEITQLLQLSQQTGPIHNLGALIWVWLSKSPALACAPLPVLIGALMLPSVGALPGSTHALMAKAAAIERQTTLKLKGINFIVRCIFLSIIIDKRFRQFYCTTLFIPYTNKKRPRGRFCFNFNFF
jgi:hypothetical protein